MSSTRSSKRRSWEEEGRHRSQGEHSRVPDKPSDYRLAWIQGTGADPNALLRITHLSEMGDWENILLDARALLARIG
jgi:hypothetical protein